ncbi:NAD(P)H-dependent oxidoreductase subunit E, partial [Tritonibacter sp. SIMBA_163]|uniref:NADH-quinone oxidoreductase subunit NuoE family protein n=1 Tax=Tritonibacter sp. SIMBA_163 TaxID=3080868 RepID=UPI0039806E59
LPYQSIEEAADFLGLAPSVVLDTATFYEEFWLQPKGRYVVWICQSISCELLGSPSLLDAVKDKLGVDVGETTEDGKFTLMSVECLG